MKIKESRLIKSICKKPCCHAFLPWSQREINDSIIISRNRKGEVSGASGLRTCPGCHMDLTSMDVFEPVQLVDCVKVIKVDKNFGTLRR